MNIILERNQAVEFFFQLHKYDGLLLENSKSGNHLGWGVMVVCVSSLGSLQTERLRGRADPAEQAVPTQKPVVWGAGITETPLDQKCYHFLQNFYFLVIPKCCVVWINWLPWSSSSPWRHAHVPHLGSLIIPESFRFLSDSFTAR